MKAKLPRKMLPRTQVRLGLKLALMIAVWLQKRADILDLLITIHLSERHQKATDAVLTPFDITPSLIRISLQ